MTNFEYIMSKMTDRNLTELFFGNWSGLNNEGIVQEILIAFTNWRETISKFNGNVYHLDRKEGNPSVFETNFFHFMEKNETVATSKNCDIAIARTNKLSFQVWLSKQYNPEEWGKYIKPWTRNVK